MSRWASHRCVVRWGESAQVLNQWSGRVTPIGKYLLKGNIRALCGGSLSFHAGLDALVTSRFMCGRRNEERCKMPIVFYLGTWGASPVYVVGLHEWASATATIAQWIDWTEMNWDVRKCPTRTNLPTIELVNISPPEGNHHLSHA